MLFRSAKREQKARDGREEALVRREQTGEVVRWGSATQWGVVGTHSNDGSESGQETDDETIDCEGVLRTESVMAWVNDRGTGGHTHQQ